MSVAFHPARILRSGLLLSTALVLVTAASAHAQETEGNADDVAVTVEKKTPDKAKKASAKSSTQLPKVTVKANASQGEGQVKGYKAGASRSSTRTDTPLLDTPQSVSVVTQDQIKDQNIHSMGQAIRYVPGITLHQGENNRDQVVIRGNSTSADFFVDGARDDLQYFRDFYNIDRVEVLKGPNAMAFGRGGAGGVINRIEKKADGTPVRQATLTAGSYKDKRIETDIGDTVSDKVALRLNGMLEDSETFRQYGNIERKGINPTATINFTDDTRLETGYEYFRDERFNDRGIPSFNGVPFSTDPKTFFGNPNVNNAQTTVNALHATLTHEFTPQTQIRNFTRFTDNSKFYQNTYPGAAVTPAGTVRITAYNNALERDSITNQTDFTHAFETGSLKHTALAGVELTRQNSEAVRNTGFFNNTTTFVNVPASNPITLAPVTFRPTATDANNHNDVSVYAGYLQDQIDINKYLQVIGGLRYDSFDIDFHDNRTGTDLGRTDGMVSPRVGVVVKPVENVSLYSSYSVSFLPSSGDQFSSLTAQSEGLKPESLQNYEVGTKWDVSPDLNVTAALYQLNRTNTRAVDPTNPANVVLTGESRTRGVELGATGRITDKWQVIGGYAYQDAEIVSPTLSGSTTVTTAGAKVALVPENIFSLWSKYDFTSQWSAALGAIYQSAQFASVDNTVRLPGYTRFDGAVFYNISPDYRVQLNVENLFDREYIATADGNNNLEPGSPQTFRVSLTTNF
ncbi:MAG: TonB-dependent siderophore receptor [Proteobacteria bacterium]|nr:TonB-dependent siderophore receptor [Pseudomonadota bacterium]